MCGMPRSDRIVRFRCDAGKLSMQILTDPADRVETRQLNMPLIAMHVGRSVYMVCQRGQQKHRGWGVHGDIDIMPAGTRSVWEPREPDTALIVAVKPDVLAATAQDLEIQSDRLELVNRFQIRDSQIEHLCWALKEEMQAGFPAGRLFLDSVATALATALIQRHSSRSLKPAPKSISMSGHRLRQLLSYIEENLTEDLSLSDIAGAAGLSVSHLKAVFRQSTGVPVHQYVIRRRVERARTLLAENKLSVNEIAQETGFSHQSHLAAHMRRVLGYTPKQIRKVERSATMNLIPK